MIATKPPSYSLPVDGNLEIYEPDSFPNWRGVRLTVNDRHTYLNHRDCRAIREWLEDVEKYFSLRQDPG